MSTVSNPETVSTSVLIIGAGGAGLRTSIELAEQGVDCLVLGKRAHGDAHTIWAAGGINASLGSLDPEDRWEIHAADTLDEGHFVNDPTAVETLCKRAPDRIRELAEWGMDFDRTDEGKINQRYFGAQSFRRTCFVGDRTGQALMDTLVQKAMDLEVPYRENLYITDLMVEGGQAAGAVGFDMDAGRPVAFDADAVVIAAGGHTSLYRRSSSRTDENTGDAQALAFNAGVPLRDMEFVQFHPTGKVKPEAEAGHLVTEAVRGEGGRLYNTEGERFMERYSPTQMELDARDVVARANEQEIREGRGTEDDAVLLDISHRDDDYIHDRLPRMVEEFAEHGIDITEEPMEVAPTAHYAMGGIEVDFETAQTQVDGLYAVGECTAGVHGANRLGGNSLIETVVFGQVAGNHIAETLGSRTSPSLSDAAVRDHVATQDTLAAAEGGHTPAEIMDRLRDLMWQHAGILRDEDGLLNGLGKLQRLRADAEDLQVQADRTSRRYERAQNLRFMFTTAETILRGALERKESRGAHARTDYEAKDPDLRKNIRSLPTGDGGMEIGMEAAGRPSRRVQQAVDEDHELDYHHLE
ncbi:succinate dehydrogenase / fumarate reductase flavoprotein subunit [Salinibacter ruber]|uniref:L-aspartate oxidase n=2 Tax=Salinibacter ruber TaxID=146919 RepID=Q2RZT8_SALRD|nr:FAD-dependent oxidoreductase [Salinibacter ruber]ABC46107.1 FAD binding domain protein [Salinibacter ruber DSM 13855]MBB4062347.1 succinate dehydrogenase / fumarate reductase flavoprotein subunit [Salinibacter ruber]MBB4069086.1 succinate dehydrogenase / fumarate reductase flavoprotein subunit [Salinibacter ruber]MCS3637744.1 succinate dehydrogenase / fumarate reductase flavoprotein subunit [Salinibacter ruber]MCS3659080.1 succinate dehydrogenase / fumarate reductase flavoprotein subunit [S